MSLRLSRLPGALVALAACAALSLASNDGHACGGCFHPENQPETTVVTGHRMVLSVSPTQSVLWDQVQYSGTPSEFAWVLPIKPGAYIEVGNDAWFETLDAATSTRVTAPAVTCNGGGFGVGDDMMEEDGGSSSGCDVPMFGCGMSASEDAEAAPARDMGGSSGSGGPAPEPPPVSVVHSGSVGPYETVTLHANEQGSLTGWLKDNGYAIDTEVQPIIDAYSSEGFDFIALKLAPDAGVQQMKPVRVVSPGAVVSLPLRMVAAGTGAMTALTLYVVGEGRWDVANFAHATLDEVTLSWDFLSSQSNYTQVRDTILSAERSTTWLTSYARQGALLGPVMNPTTGQPVQYTLSSGSTSVTLADAYFQQGVLDEEATEYDCTSYFDAYADSELEVVDPCPADGSECGEVSIDQIDARLLACGTLDDISTALVGMHPRDVWVTRLEANLPRLALKSDLEMGASSDQITVENWHTPTTVQNSPCPQSGAPTIAPPPRPDSNRWDRSRRRANGMLAFLGIALAIAIARRATRRNPAALVAR